MTRILIVEDEARVADFLSRGLRAEGYTPTVARAGDEGLQAAQTGEFDVILLDLRLPGLPGQEVCRNIRADGNNTPILMLTAMDATEDKVHGLKLGADDYLTKPFSFEELLARVEALVRRSRNVVVRASRLAVGDIVLDRETLTVRQDGRKVELTAKELALLELLMVAPGRVFTRARILSGVWGYTADPLTNVVDVYIRRLRRKLGDVITTVRGHGYRLDPSPEPDSGDGGPQ